MNPVTTPIANPSIPNTTPFTNAAVRVFDRAAFAEAEGDGEVEGDADAADVAGGRIMNSAATSISAENAVSCTVPETNLPAAAPTYEPIIPGPLKSSTVGHETSRLRV